MRPLAEASEAHAAAALAIDDREVGDPLRSCPTRRPLGGPSSSRAEALPDSHAAAAATAWNGHVGAIIFVSNSTSRHWDVHFDGTIDDLSTDGRIQARGIPCGPGEALGPVRRAIPGRRIASADYALFCTDFLYIVPTFHT